MSKILRFIPNNYIAIVFALLATSCDGISEDNNNQQTKYSLGTPAELSLSEVNSEPAFNQLQHELRQLACPNQEIIELAIKSPIIYFNRQIKGGAHTRWFHAGEMGLAATAACGDKQADTRLLEQIRNILTPGRGPTLPAGYADQHQLGILATITLVNKIERLWQELTDDEQAKIKLIMEAALISNAFLTSDNNPYVKGAGPQRAIDGDKNVNRDWNPNFRNGNLGSVIMSTIFFGPDQAKHLLKTHSHKNFIAKLKLAELDNLVETFELSDTPSDDQIEQTLHADYSYYDITLDHPFQLFLNLTNATFNKTVSCGLNNGKGKMDTSSNRGGYIAANCNKLPNLGSRGMLSEMDSSDGKGPRSATSYANDGLRPNTYIHYVLVALNYWEDTPKSQELLQRIKIGAADLFFKLDPAKGGGYYDYHKGNARGLKQLNDAAGHRVTNELINVVFSYHNR